MFVVSEILWTMLYLQKIYSMYIFTYFLVTLLISIFKCYNLIPYIWFIQCIFSTKSCVWNRYSDKINSDSNSCKTSEQIFVILFGIANYGLIIMSYVQPYKSNVLTAHQNIHNGLSYLFRTINYLTILHNYCHFISTKQTINLEPWISQ